MGVFAKLWRSLTGADEAEERARRILEQARSRSEQELKNGESKARRSGPIRRIFK